MSKVMLSSCLLLFKMVPTKQSTQLQNAFEFQKDASDLQPINQLDLQHLHNAIELYQINQLHFQQLLNELKL